MNSVLGYQEANTQDFVELDSLLAILNELLNKFDLIERVNLHPLPFTRTYEVIARDLLIKLNEHPKNPYYSNLIKNKERYNHYRHSYKRSFSTTKDPINIKLYLKPKNKKGLF
jgi:hypothetical protein